METSNDEKYKRAQERVKKIKGFYTHLVVYILVNIFLALSQLGIFSGSIHIGMPIWSYFTTPFFWGIGLLFHGLYVFRDSFGFFRNWEERKIREYIEKEEKEYKDTFNGKL